MRLKKIKKKLSEGLSQLDFGIENQKGQARLKIITTPPPFFTP